MSSGFELFAATVNDCLHAAVLYKGAVWDLYTDPATPLAGSWASLYQGKVVKLDTRLDAAIVDLGNGLSGLLPAKHVHMADADASERRSGISDLLDPGQTLLVQVKSEAKAGSEHEQHKLPRLTTKIYAMGQFLFYSPVASRVTVSRQIENEKILKFTTGLKGPGGWLVQTAANRATEDDIEAEAKLLLQDWQKISDAAEAGGNKPKLLRAGPNAIVRALTDYGAASFDHIHVADKSLLDIVTAWSGRLYPHLATSKRLRLFKPEKAGQTLFDIHDIHAVLETLGDPHAYLDCGGSIIIEPTHAITVVDVNQGSADSTTETNRQAALEVARQIRLRNMSGAVLVDFINMQIRTERYRLMETLNLAFQNDSALAQVHGFTRLGIIEITRKRRDATLAEKRKAR